MFQTGMRIRVGNVYADPGPAFHFDADPEPIWNFIADTDQRLHFEPLQLLNFDFNADPDADPAFHSNADPDPASQSNAAPDPQAWFRRRRSFRCGNITSCGRLLESICRMTSTQARQASKGWQVPLRFWNKHESINQVYCNLLDTRGAYTCKFKCTTYPRLWMKREIAKSRPEWRPRPRQRRDFFLGFMFEPRNRRERSNFAQTRSRSHREDFSSVRDPARSLWRPIHIPPICPPPKESLFGVLVHS